MYLSHIFQQLTQGEISQLSVAGTDAIGIQPSDYEKVIPHINLALIDLYKRFSLKMGEVSIQEYASISTYILHNDYAASNTESEQPIKYIEDTAENPFTNDILKIMRIKDEDGTKLDLNDYTLNDYNELQEETLTTVFIPTYDSIQPPSPTDTGTLLISYRASPVLVEFDDYDDLNPETYDIRIPDFLLEAMLQFITSRMLRDEESDKAMLKYEASVKRVTDLALVLPDDNTNLKLLNNGWV